jgi:coenzyme F420 biosynthesis associated uncharacterized protein
MIDWSLARRVAGAVARDAGVGEPLPGNLAALAAHAEKRVVDYTGLTPAAALPAPEAVGRDEWIRVNLATMESTLAPLTDRLAPGAESGPIAGTARAATGTLMAAEIGAITGYMGGRVMGQYELALLDPTAPPRLLFVAPNVRSAAGQLGADLEELLTWVAFHEVTHAVQFGAVGWLREHLAAQLRELLESVDLKPDMSALMRLPSLDDLRALVETVREGGLVAVVAGSERRAMIDRLQAAMAMIEGHAEHVMDAAGAGDLPSLTRLREALDRRRRERPPLQRLIDRLLGMDLKLRQYDVGKRFCDAVVRADGIRALNRAWERPELLPSLAELGDPDAWLRRTRVPLLRA